MKKLKLATAILLIFSTVFLTGCWNYREIDSLIIVSGIAIDSGENGYKYHLTFECAFMSPGKDQSRKPKLIETDGDTILDAVRNSIKQSDQRLYFGDCKVVIISSKLAKEGLTPIIDYFNRYYEPRITVELVISTEEKAGDILKHDDNSQEISAYTINKLIENNIYFLGKGTDVALFQANNILGETGISLILPSVAMLDTNSKKIPEITGTAVFKYDKLIGFLTGDQSRYLLTINNNLKGGIIVPNVDSIYPNVSLEISNSRTKRIPSVSDGIPKIKLQITTEVVFAEENSTENILNNLGIEEVEKCAENTVKNGVLDLIKYVQQNFNSDIFGFGSCIYKKYPAYWKENCDKWDQLFPEIEPDVSVDIKITNIGTANVRTD